MVKINNKRLVLSILVCQLVFCLVASLFNPSQVFGVAYETPYKLKDIRPENHTYGPVGITADYASLNGSIYFSADDGAYGYELWKSDGTESGTVMVKDIVTGASSSSPEYLITMGSYIYFQIGYELWRSNGTEEGTAMVKSFTRLVEYCNNHVFTVHGDHLYFNANDGSGYALWKSDGTTDGTVKVKAIEPNCITSTGTNLFFTASDGAHGNELWISDGTDAGTKMLKDIRSGGSSSSSNPSYLTAFKGSLYFNAWDGISPSNYLWKSDGTELGTSIFKTIYPFAMVAGDNILYIQATVGAQDSLWKSDGTTLGTSYVVDISNINDFVTVNDTLFYNDSGGELWKSDGTAPGTEKLAENASYFSEMNNKLYFIGKDSTYGEELWMSDGTVVGTVRVADINPGTGDSSAYWRGVAGTNVFFSADETGTGQYRLYSLISQDEVIPTFNNLPGLDVNINITEGQTITTNPFTIKVRPNDNQGISKVEFYIDGTLICTDTTPDVDGVYSCDWDTSKYHSEVRVIVYDTSGNTISLYRNAFVDPSLYSSLLPETGADEFEYPLVLRPLLNNLD